jgi:hypothetical protein
MKYLPLAALGAALVMTGCVAYPVDRYHDGGDRGAYRDGGARDDHGDRRDERRDRGDRNDRDRDRDGEHRDWQSRP